MIFVVINQTNKHKARIYNQCTYTQIIIKKFHNYIKKIFRPSNIKKTNSTNRKISGYENKSKEDLIKST